MKRGPPWVKRHSKPNPYTLTWENDVIHYSVPVATFSPIFRVQSMPLIELSLFAQTRCKPAYQSIKDTPKPNPYTLTWENDVIHYSVPVATFSPRFRIQSMPLIELSPLAQTECKSAHHGSNATRNQIPIL